MLPNPVIPNQPDLHELYRVLGQGMARWQYIETGLYLAAFGAMRVDHATCSAKFFKNPGAGSRLNFADGALKKALERAVYEADWIEIRDNVRGFVVYRNCLAHFETFHIDARYAAMAVPSTKFRVMISGRHLNAAERAGDQVRSLSIESIKENNEKLIELSYVLAYFVVDHFPLDRFLGKGLLPMLEQNLIGFVRNPRPPEFPPRLGPNSELR
jgi:hypothetical protein